MNKFVLITATFGVPLLAFVMLQDAVATFYRPDEPETLAYQVVEPEEEVVVEEVETTEPEAEIASTDDEEVPVESEEPAPEVELDVTETETETETEAEADVEEQPAADQQVAALSEEELAAGQKAVRKCAACHQVAQERNGVGPHLVGVIGRPIGSVDGFKYSDALQELNAAGEVWTTEAMAEWLENPAGFAAGTKMNFKVRKEEERKLIADWFAANGG